MSRPTLTPSPSPITGEGNFERAGGAEISLEAA
jgi:hypothetical protein